MDRWTWLGFGAGVLALAGYLLGAFFGQDRRIFLPGPTSHGHYQIELSCASCHTPMLGLRPNACEDCHGEELAAADDSHPAAKFRDPRNAALLERIDAMRCATCHVEHRPELTGPMGVTMPQDYCVRCHDDIGEERPNHRAYDFTTCQNAGCHNFHDNRALSEDFLAAHMEEPGMLARPHRVLVERSPADAAGELDATEHDAPTAEIDATMLDVAVAEWQGSSHARAGVNCRGCHDAPAGASGKPSKWMARPTHESCSECHRAQVESFLDGRHGMRLQARLSPMQPGMARLSMRPEARDRELTCSACHGAHHEVPYESSTVACLDCHADEHSLAYESSKHALAWQREVLGQSPAGSGVSCATCHLPAARGLSETTSRWTHHNQNDNLRPNEKMVRTVCQQCHGLEFSLQSLADAALVRRNFQGMPSGTSDALRLVREKRGSPAGASTPQE